LIDHLFPLFVANVRLAARLSFIDIFTNAHESIEDQFIFALAAITSLQLWLKTKLYQPAFASDLTVQIISSLL
jgi:hypothetical protein